LNRALAKVYGDGYFFQAPGENGLQFVKYMGGDNKDFMAEHLNAFKRSFRETRRSH
jgi:hypothetical protein